MDHYLGLWFFQSAIRIAPEVSILFSQRVLHLMAMRQVKTIKSIKVI